MVPHHCGWYPILVSWWHVPQCGRLCPPLAHTSPPWILMRKSRKETSLEISFLQGHQVGHSSLQAPLDKSVLPCSLSPPTAQEAQTGSGRDDYPHPELLSSPLLGPSMPAKSNIWAKFLFKFSSTTCFFKAVRHQAFIVSSQERMWNGPNRCWGEAFQNQLITQQTQSKCIQ